MTQFAVDCYEFFCGACGGKESSAFFLANCTHLEGGFAVFGDGEDALDETFGVASGVNEAGLVVGDVLGLAAFGGGDDGEANDAGFLDGVR